MKYLFLFFILLTSCNPAKDVPKHGKSIYKTILKFMDDSKEPPPAVKKFIEEKRKKL